MYIDYGFLVYSANIINVCEFVPVEQCERVTQWHLKFVNRIHRSERNE